MEGDCVVYFSYKDISKLEKLLRDKTVAERERGLQLVNETVAYVESAECRRKFLLHYFGEAYTKSQCNDKCDNCRHPKERIDVTQDTKTAIDAIAAVKENHDLPYLVKFLLGKKSKEITDFKYDKLSTFGAGASKDEHHWNSVLRNAMMIGLIDKDIEQYGILKLNDSSRTFMKKPTKVTVALNHNYEEDGADIVVEESGGARSVVDPQLLNMLKDLRQKTAKASNLPTYVVFQENSLEEMATKYPITMDELTGIIGVRFHSALSS
jgi:ATP-dependent DNA helicase RecQ